MSASQSLLILYGEEAFANLGRQDCNRVHAASQRNMIPICG